MCLHPISVPVKVNGRITDFNVVPCGHCPECLDRKQKDMMQVFLNIGNRSSSIVFATFTYDDEHLPYLWSLYDHETEQASYQSFDVSLPESHLSDYDPVSLVSTPSLRRRDWRLWLKSARIKFERDFGHKISPFSYSCIGEYGKVHFRPHYHCLFFGLSLSEAQELCKSWDYGFSYCQFVRRDQSLTAICRYMAKYLYKGLFEAPDVLYKLVEKPRVLNSRGLVKIDDNFVSWLTGRDLGITLDTRFLNDELCERLLSRRRLLIDNFSYCLGRHYIDKIFKRYETDSEGKTKLVSTPLQKALSDFVRRQSHSFYDRPYRKLKSQYGDEVAASMCVEIIRSDEAAKQSKNESLSQTLQEYYRRSKF